MTDKIDFPNAILRRRKVEDRTGLSRSTIYARIGDGTFPPPIKIGARAVGWLASDVDEWIIDQVKQTKDRNPARGAAA